MKVLRLSAAAPAPHQVNQQSSDQEATKDEKKANPNRAQERDTIGRRIASPRRHEDSIMRCQNERDRHGARKIKAEAPPVVRKSRNYPRCWTAGPAGTAHLSFGPSSFCIESAHHSRGALNILAGGLTNVAWQQYSPLRRGHAGLAHARRPTATPRNDPIHLPSQIANGR